MVLPVVNDFISGSKGVVTVVCVLSACVCLCVSMVTVIEYVLFEIYPTCGYSVRNERVFSW